MKKLFVLSIITLLLFSCSKNDTPTASNPPHAVAKVDGSLELNIYKLTLHINNSATVFAKEFDIHGNLVTNPSFSWSSSNTLVATVNNGTITAKGIGTCEVTVNDGIHSDAIVSISVVESSVAIATTATQAYIQNSLVVMQPNSSIPLPLVTLYNASGQIVNAPITYLPSAESGLSFTSNTVSSNASTGEFEVLIKVGNETLASRLRVLVTTTNSVSYSVVMVDYSYPKEFYDINISSPRPVLIKVTKTWYENDQQMHEQFITSPDKIELNDSCVILNSQGYLTSQNVSTTSYSDTFVNGPTITIQAGCIAKVLYKDAFTKFGMSVCQNITGNWGCTLSNGDSFNYCITQSGPELSYGSPHWSSEATTLANTNQLLSGTYKVIENGAPYLYGTSNTFTGYYVPRSGGFLLNTQHPIKILHDGETTNLSPEFTFDGNFMSSNHGGHNYDKEFSLVNGAGNCDNSNPGNLPTVNILSITGIQQHSAIVTYEVVSDGGSPLNYMGVEYGYQPFSTGYYLTAGTTNPSLGIHTITINNVPDGLIAGTAYNVRAYATNDNGITYSNVLTFNTLP